VLRRERGKNEFCCCCCDEEEEEEEERRGEERRRVFCVPGFWVHWAWDPTHAGPFV